MHASFLQTDIAQLRGVGPQHAKVLQKELRISTYNDLLAYYPFRYEDRTRIHPITALKPGDAGVQVAGIISKPDLGSFGKQQRLCVNLTDGTGTLCLVWFQGLDWMRKKLQTNSRYLVFGKPLVYRGKLSMIHPSISTMLTGRRYVGRLQPVYATTELLTAQKLNSRGIERLQSNLLPLAKPHISEALPDVVVQRYRLVSRQKALQDIHFPASQEALHQAKRRLKFEEFFFLQLRLFLVKAVRLGKPIGNAFCNTSLLRQFCQKHLNFSLTAAQQRVLKQIYGDLRSGRQMNRLLQGDVASGKTIVAFLSMLIPLADQAQVALMAPTEILAEQHHQNLQKYAAPMNLEIGLLTGSTAHQARKELHDRLATGDLQVLVGTHALLQESVKFRQLGLTIIDEQHRFGVAQRAKLSQKRMGTPPHVLIMTATPIPRTLAMTLYGDLDVAVIDQMPPGRKPVKTIHYYDAQRLQMLNFVQNQIDQGRQIYMVYPLIEASEAIVYKDLMDGYESMARAFPNISLGVLHGKMKRQDKAHAMRCFATGRTKILIATTVIEVGVHVSNATVMVIENAERFGLTQLHQLRGRVGRDATQSYCILMTNNEISPQGKERIKTMLRTNDGFEIADVDLQMRGPGDLMGVQQSGLPDLKLAKLAKDGAILQVAHEVVQSILQSDPELSLPQNKCLAAHLQANRCSSLWSKIG